LSDLPELILDAAGWVRADDVYDAFFAAVGAPSWHGRNLDALRDSISTGSINQIEVPYLIIVRNASMARPDARRMLNLFLELIERVQAEGCPVEMKVMG
jgi:RNAse (barnase) inhibitor barstar